MTREAELQARDFVTLVPGGLAAETEVGVVQRLLLQAQTALASYAEPTGRSSRAGRRSSRRCSTSPAAPSRAPTTSSRSSTRSPGRCSRPRRSRPSPGWREETAPLEGLVVDTDLRWRLLHALVAHGAAGAGEVEAELARDNTATGLRMAERARALVPTPEAKATAWQRAVYDDSLPNAINMAIIMGFSHPSQGALLAPYTEKYFAAVDEVWGRRSSEQAQPMVQGLFPSWAVEQATVDAADRWLADEHPSALRRLVTEGRAGIVRALAARDFDRS